jgi:hypothetical protein
MLMATVNMTWTTAKVSVPVTTDLTQYRASIDGVGETMVAFGTLNAQFNDVAPGDYIARVALSNADGSHVDFEKSQAFTVAADTLELDAPDVISVQVA